MVRDGKFPLPMKPPMTPGFEGAEIVEMIGAGVEARKTGDEVRAHVVSVDGAVGRASRSPRRRLQSPAQLFMISPRPVDWGSLP
ncbi:MAG: hypothetical protein ACLPYS_04055 [Vulcanimicrobiaceae bacterium]